MERSKQASCEGDLRMSGKSIPGGGNSKYRALRQECTDLRSRVTGAKWVQRERLIGEQG